MILDPFAARANAFDNERLCHDIDEILKTSSAQHLFNVEELSNLRDLLKSSDVEAIDRIAATRTAIEITINPEARISVRRASAHLPVFACNIGEPLLIRVINQGHVSSNLNIGLLEDMGRKAAVLEPLKPHLAGAEVEYRLLIMTINAVRPIELTLVADVGPSTYDLALRSQLPLIVKC
jgi:hypothetical protein